MNNTIKIPVGSIEVVPSFEDNWEFRFPRLDGRVHDAFSEALEEFDADNLGEAERGIQALLGEYPEFIDAYHHLAIILDRTGKHKEARQFWETAVRIGLWRYFSTALQEAVKILPNVAKELLKKTHRTPKNQNTDHVTHGGADQAYYYWQDYGQYWKNTKGAMEMLSAVFRK